MKESEAVISRIEPRGRMSRYLILEAGEIAESIVPGQFVQVRVGTGTDPFLRRTFSVCGADPDKGTLSLLVDIVGRGTRLMCGCTAGETLNIIGPLGTGFSTRGVTASSRCMFVGGGTGAAPLLFCASLLARDHGCDITFLYGGRDESALELIGGPVAGSVHPVCATEDGSAGYHGLVTGLMREQADKRRPTHLFTCGPHAMMREVARFAGEKGIPCQVSLEERMACGIGACLGCAVAMADGRMLRSCVDGPVFNAEEVAW